MNPIMAFRESATNSRTVHTTVNGKLHVTNMARSMKFTRTKYTDSRKNRKLHRNEA